MIWRSNWYILIIKNCLINDYLWKWMKNDWKNEYEKILKNCINIMIKYNEDHDKTRWILIFLQKESILDMKKMKIIEFLAKKIYFHEKWNIWYYSD